MSTFDELLGLCNRINPTSFTGEDIARTESVTVHGLNLVPEHWEWKGKRILILGCGDGYEVKYARDVLGWDAYGLTFLSKESQRAGELHNCAQYIYSQDMHDLNALSQYDGVYSKECLEHSPCPFLVLMELNEHLADDSKFFHLIPGDWAKQRDWYHFSCFPDWVWCDLFRKAGFKVEKVTTFPNCDKATFSNLAYSGYKMETVRYYDTMEQWRTRLGFSHMLGSEG